MGTDWNYYEAQVGSGLRFLGGAYISAPAYSFFNISSDLIIGEGTDANYYHPGGDGFIGGTGIGAAAMAPASVASMNVFVEGSDHAVYFKTYNGQSWSPSKTFFNGLGGSLQ